MNYVYDILVNFKYPIIDFYEWNDNDDIDNIKKVVFIKINKDDLLKLLNNKFKLKDIKTYKNTTKLFNNKTYNSLICTDGENAFAFKFDNNGLCIAKSALLPDEETEILVASNLVALTNLDYEIISNDNLEIFLTRKEKSMRELVINNLKNISSEDEFKYVCYECLRKENDITKHDLINKIKTCFDEKYYNLYDFFISISMNNKEKML